MPFTHLTVVSTAAWIARDLAAAGTIPVRAVLGLDVPDLTGSALWCPGPWATRLMKTGASRSFTSAGPDWLARVPGRYLRRKIWCGTLGELERREDFGPGFYKLSEHKHSLVPAEVHASSHDFTEHVHAAFDAWPGAGSDVLDLNCTVSGLMDYRHEYRCFIARGTVTAASQYLSRLPGIHGGDVTVTWDAYQEDRCPDPSEASAFAQEVANAMESDQPPGYTLDVGCDAEGRWSVIEANAAWSSGIYHAPRSGVIESVLASQEPGHDEWLWSPDHLFLSRARALPAG